MEKMFSLDEVSNSCAVDLVDKIISNSIAKSSSDIHLESMENFLRVRYRIDGILYDQEPINLELMNQILSRIKVLANIDIAQKRIPQDGKFKFIINNNPIDLRVSTFPSVYGEKIVIRILDRIKTKIDLCSLGFDETTLQNFEKLISKNSGFILVTGPTGSGKTTTLYAALSSIHTSEKNIITLEDPVEYHIEGVTQGQINLSSGFTFAKGIRSLLRQDPDIAMIGEIRDQESAKIAIEAALTGHLVFSTLHTNDAASTIMRLMDMAVESFLINAAITGVLAQRLARKICIECKIEVNPTSQEKIIMNNLLIKKIFKGKGCKFCNGGYKGRTGIFELLVMTDDLRTLIVESPKFQDIKMQAINDGMKTLIEDASQKVQEGIITLDELIRVIL
jgi:type II secretory ATPase GspE/PulE/Tfp pilus assembly ATPase PilB-like protein